ncbi:DUF7504 family protein [Halorarius litoreus]|uniref:DUF7504 family protein n=1 Tax=Halorarius litoreus TaxID=2962676 RepID=UPI0020CE73D7|nr:hypothetical protein [Halorarius litoreus]
MSDESLVRSGLGDARSVLVLADGLSPARDAACGALLARAAPDQLNVMAVTYNRGAGAWIDHTESALGGAPRSIRLVDTGGGSEADPAVGVEAPDDLTGLEIAIADPLPYDDGTTVFCFDSLTALLQYVDTDRAYRFLHALVERLWSADVYAHVHMAPGAHDPQTVVTFAALFDAVVATDSDALPSGVDATVVADGEELVVSWRPRFEPEGNA